MIAYRHQRGEASFLVMSHVIRQADKIGPRRCFRHGERHTFLHSGLIEVIDPASGDLIEIAREVRAQYPDLPSTLLFVKSAPFNKSLTWPALSKTSALGMNAT